MCWIVNCVTLKFFLKELNNVNFVKNVMQPVSLLKTPAEQLLFERYKNGFMLILFLMK
jgi:hypothetical protein